MLAAAWIDVLFIRCSSAFPLDDAYIYLQYIENLAAGKGLCFNPGEISFGVTSLLYPLICAALAWAGPFLEPILWMKIAGLLTHAALIYLAQRLIYCETGNLALSCLGGFTLALCRPLYYTAPAGLETLLFHALALGLFWASLRTPRVHPVLIGLLAGFLFLTRPEGLVVVAGYVFFLLLHSLALRQSRFRFAWRECAWFLGGFAVMAAPYTIYIRIHSGLWLPTTYYGKLLAHNDFTAWSIGRRIREGVFAIADGYKEIILIDATQSIYCLLIGLTSISLLIFVYRSGSGAYSPQRFAARATMLSLLLFPVLFGSAFHINVQFGGYAVRYIQIVAVLIHIEAALALGAIASRLFASVKWRNIAGVLLMAPLLIFLSRGLWTILPQDLDFFRVHSEIRQGVRMQAAEWIRDNTPADARVLAGSTGLGVIGAYCERYVKDEGGLINPDIYPFFTTEVRADIPHWHRMMEYMKRESLDYYTTYASNTYHNPLSHPTRHTTLAKQVHDPAMLGHFDGEVLSEIHVYRFDAWERYDLWHDSPDHVALLDRAEPPVIEGRFLKTEWNGRNTIALKATWGNYFEAAWPLMFPGDARFRASLAVDLPERDYQPEEWIQLRVYVDRGQEREVVFSEEYKMAELENRTPIAELDLDLSAFSDRFASLVLATGTSLTEDGGAYWAGWIDPVLVNANLNESE